MAIVIRTILEAGDISLRFVENVNRVWLLLSSIVDHHIRAVLTVVTCKDQLLRDGLRVLCVDVSNTIGPFQSREDSKLNCLDNVR